MRFDIEKKIFDTIEENRLFKSCGGLVLAVSGGPDSMALLDFFIRHREQFAFPLVCATLNHGLRAQAEQETGLVRQFCQKNGVPFEELFVDIRREKPKGESVETFSRNVRYAFFAGIRNLYGFTHIATAHHADDSCESIVLNLVRGCGLDGLRGIPVCREDGVVRPLLRCRKSELAAYCKENAVPFAIDATNLESLYRRNTVRNRILPELEKLNPDFCSAALRLAECAEQTETYLQSEAALLGEKAALDGGFDLQALREAPAAVLTAFLRRQAKNLCQKTLTFEQTGRLAELVRSGKTSNRTAFYDYFAEIGYHTLFFYSRSESQTAFEPFVPLSGENHFGGATLTIQKGAAYDSGRDCIKILPLEQCVVRSRREGDFFYPAKGNGGKLLKKLYCDAKIPRAERMQIPVLEYGGQPVWAGGFGTDKRFLPEKGGGFFRLEWQKPE